MALSAWRFEILRAKRNKLRGAAFSAPGSPDLTASVTETLLVNEANKVNEQGRIIGTAPGLPSSKTREVRTRFTSSGKPLQEPRKIMSGFTVPDGVNPARRWSWTC
jgi:hypothetical protein